MEPQNKKVLYLSSNTAVFYVDCHFRDGMISGRVTNVCYRMLEPFCGLDKMLMAIDDMCEAMQFPMSDTIPRSFSNSASRVLPQPLGDGIAEDMENCFRPAPMGSAAAAKKLTGQWKKNISFLVQVIYRQHSSLQGLVVRQDKTGEKVYFRSALELMRMLDLALRDQQ